MDTKLIDQMSTEEKLFAMEQLWDSLKQSSNYPLTPEWHGEVLEERSQLLESGESKLITLDDLRKKLK